MIAIVSNIPPSSPVLPRSGAPKCNSNAVVEALQQPSLLLFLVAERKGHRAVDHRLAVHARDAFEQSHAAAQANHVRFDDDDVAGIDGAAIADALDAGEEGQALSVFRL